MTTGLGFGVFFRQNVQAVLGPRKFAEAPYHGRSEPSSSELGNVIPAFMMATTVPRLNILRY